MTLFDTGALLGPPATEPTCPACGGENRRRHPRDPRCERCARAGIDAPTLLSLDPGTIHTPGTLDAGAPGPEPEPEPADDEHQDDEPAPPPCPEQVGLGWSCQLDAEHPGPCQWPEAAYANNAVEIAERAEPCAARSGDRPCTLTAGHWVRDHTQHSYAEPSADLPCTYCTHDYTEHNATDAADWRDGACTVADCTCYGWTDDPEDAPDYEPEPVPWPPSDPVAHACTFLAPWTAERVRSAATIAEAVESLRMTEGVGYHGACTDAGCYQAEARGVTLAQTVADRIEGPTAIRVTFRAMAEHLRADQGGLF